MRRRGLILLAGTLVGILPCGAATSQTAPSPVLNNQVQLGDVFSGQTLNVENVATFTGEVLFWIAVVFSNSLGTSTGDYLAGGLGMGLGPAVLLLTVAMLLILAAHYLTKINAMLLFWVAFILTRPWGAEMGNILSRNRDHGGLGWGNAGASTVLVAGLAVLVAYQSVDVRRHPLKPLPLPANRRTGQPQRPNGKVITVAPR